MTDTALPFDTDYLDKLADVIVGTGLNLAHGQDLVITASAEALPLVRRVTVAAYKAGAGLVTPILSDEAISRARFQHGHDGTFDRAPGWLYAGMAEAYDANAARPPASPLTTGRTGQGLGRPPQREALPPRGHPRHH